MTRDCSPHLINFFNDIMSKFSKLNDAVHRLFAFQGITNLLECSRYLAKFYYFATQRQTTMVCPRHYEGTLSQCQRWALTYCKISSSYERAWLRHSQPMVTDVRTQDLSRKVRSAWACHAGLAGIMKYFYELSGGSCENSHITNLKKTLFRLTDALGDLQSLIHVVDGKPSILIKTTDAIHTSLNQVIKNVQNIESTLQQWKITLNTFGKSWRCKISTILEFLGKLSAGSINIFFTILRLIETKDIVQQTKNLERKALTDLASLPTFVATELTRKLKQHSELKVITEALQTGFPLLLEPLVNFEHSHDSLKLNILMTVPQLQSQNDICTLEYLVPLKYNVSGICYTGLVTRKDLALITCPNSRTIVRADVLANCLKDKQTFVCSDIYLPRSDDAKWLGMYWTPGTKVTFNRRHKETLDCDKLKALVHLRGRYYLALADTALRIKNKTEELLPLSPLLVYHFPCDIHLFGQQTGLGVVHQN